MKGVLMLHVEVNGLSIAYEQAGDGPALVLLHGFTQDSRVWSPQLGGLSTRFTVIAWDAPGAGQSLDPPETFRISDWAQCIAGHLDAIGVQQAHILGLSWGGILAQEFYRQYDERVLSLVLAGTYAGWKGSLSASILKDRLAACLQDASLPPSDFVSLYLPGMFSESPPQEAQERLAGIMFDFHPIGFRLMAASSAQTDTRDLLPNIKVPTLLIWGDADKRSPLSVAYQMRDAIPAARLAVISGAGHVSNLEDPTRFNGEVLAFCSPIQSLNRQATRHPK
jgi:pimeloyl-ACP methyl ester carboxylesterase